MSCDEVFVEYLLELLTPFGEVASKRMFGGYGFFLDGLMFGLVSESTFYLKTDDENKALFDNRGLEPFIYEKTNKSVVMSYYQAPEEAFDNSEEMTYWAQSAFDAAKRAKLRKSSQVSESSESTKSKAPTDSDLDIDLDMTDTDTIDADQDDIQISLTNE